MARRFVTILLCPGTIHFNSEIVLQFVLTESITISCSGPVGSCILDANGDTRHFKGFTVGKTLAFIDLTFINGLVDNDSSAGSFGGSLNSFGSGATIILTGCVFYNNHATSLSGDSAVSIYQASNMVVSSHAWQYYSDTHFFH